jgi:hypothetical protein
MLLDETGDFGGPQNARASEVRRRQQICQGRSQRASQPGTYRNLETTFAAQGTGRREQARSHPAEKDLVSPEILLEPPRQTESKIDNLVIEVRDPDLEGMCHRHSIHLGKEITGQECATIGFETPIHRVNVGPLEPPPGKRGVCSVDGSLVHR